MKSSLGNKEVAWLTIFAFASISHAAADYQQEKPAGSRAILCRETTSKSPALVSQVSAIVFPEASLSEIRSLVRAARNKKWNSNEAFALSEKFQELTDRATEHAMKRLLPLPKIRPEINFAKLNFQSATFNSMYELFFIGTTRQKSLSRKALQFQRGNQVEYAYIIQDYGGGRLLLLLEDGTEALLRTNESNSDAILIGDDRVDALAVAEVSKDVEESISSRLEKQAPAKDQYSKVKNEIKSFVKSKLNATLHASLKPAKSGTDTLQGIIKARLSSGDTEINYKYVVPGGDVEMNMFQAFTNEINEGKAIPVAFISNEEAAFVPVGTLLVDIGGNVYVAGLKNPGLDWGGLDGFSNSQNLNGQTVQRRGRMIYGIAPGLTSVPNFQTQELEKSLIAYELALRKLGR